MLRKRLHIQLFIGIMVLMLLPLMPSVRAADWEGGFIVSVSYSELNGKDQGSADVTMTMILPSGTPLLGKEAAVSSALAALKDIWSTKSVHEDVLGFLGPQIPMEVQKTVSELNGSQFLMEVIHAFDTVENAGYSRFQADTSVSATEQLTIASKSLQSDYPDAPRSFTWIIGGGLTAKDTSRENWVLATLVNYSAALLSYRSELGRFPRSIAELRESGHLFIEPLNPYSGQPIKEVPVGKYSAGDISYQYMTDNRAILFTYMDLGFKVETEMREFNLPAQYDYLYRQTAGLTDDEKQVARYLFQVSQILSDYYSQHKDLPYSVPQCETEGFAYVSFPNPYTHRDAAQADSLAAIQPGDYTYHRISSSSYFLVGYGGSGQRIISISRDYGSTSSIIQPLGASH